MLERFSEHKNHRNYLYINRYTQKKYVPYLIAKKIKFSLFCYLVDSKIEKTTKK